MGDETSLSTKIVNSSQKSDFSYWLVLKMFRAQFLGLIGISQETYSALDPSNKIICRSNAGVYAPHEP